MAALVSDPLLVAPAWTAAPTATQTGPFTWLWNTITDFFTYGLPTGVLKWPDWTPAPLRVVAP